MGEDFPRASGEALEPIAGEALRKVLKRQGRQKATGAGGWNPNELALLPDDWLAALGAMIGLGSGRRHCTM